MYVRAREKEHLYSVLPPYAVWAEFADYVNSSVKIGIMQLDVMFQLWKHAKNNPPSIFPHVFQVLTVLVLRPSSS